VQGTKEWLDGLGLGEYAPRFAENDIDFTILSDLTDQDLEKIGIASLGHRRKLLRAIAALDGAPGATAAAPEPPPVMPAVPIAAAAAKPTVSAASTGVEGERRYLTVMFCDLVGSTGISAKLDAEEWRDLVGSYLDAATAAVTEMGGHVAKKLGDGLMVLFGYPVAQENDSERAVRAALSIQRALAELNRNNAGAGKPALNARIGVEPVPWSWMRRAKFSAAPQTSRRGFRHWPSRARFWSRRGCSARSPGCLWRKSGARTRSRACPSRRCCSGWCVRAAAAAAPAGAISRR
jgi:hypothetical protein